MLTFQCFNVLYVFYDICHITGISKWIGRRLSVKSIDPAALNNLQNEASLIGPETKQEESKPEE